VGLFDVYKERRRVLGGYNRYPNYIYSTKSPPKGGRAPPPNCRCQVTHAIGRIIDVDVLYDDKRRYQITVTLE